MRRLNEVQNTLAAQSYLDGVRGNIKQVGAVVCLDNAIARPLSPRHKRRRVVRQPVIGPCLTLLGAVFLVGAASGGSVEVGQMVVGMIVGLIFLLTGYVLMAYRDTFSVDTATGRWRQTKGTVPFLRHASGSLSAARGLRLCRETRTAYGPQGNWDYEVWAAQIVWQDPSLAPLNLDALDLPCNYVEYDQAATACLRYGTTIGLPLLEADEASAEKNDAQDAF